MTKNSGTRGTSREERRGQSWVRTSVSSQKQGKDFEHLEDVNEGVKIPMNFPNWDHTIVLLEALSLLG